MKSLLTCCVAALVSGSVFGCSRHLPGFVVLSLSLQSSGDDAGGEVGTPLRGDSATAVYGRDTLFIQDVALLVRDVEIAPSEAGDCEGSPEEHEEECPQLATGPEVLRISLAGRPDSRRALQVTPGEYSLLQFQIQMPDPIRDTAFLSTHPEFLGSSAHLRGVLSRAGSRTPVNFAFPFNEREILDLSPPMVVAPAGTTQVTLHIAATRWLANAAQSALIDPSTADQGQPEAGLVRDNIRMSLTASSAP